MAVTSSLLVDPPQQMASFVVERLRMGVFAIAFGPFLSQSTRQPTGPLGREPLQRTLGEILSIHDRDLH